jgi:hypothetical protein
MSLTDGSFLLGEKRSIDKTGLYKISRKVFFSSKDSAVSGTYDEVGNEYSGALFVGGGGTGDEAGNWICQWNYEKVAGSGDLDSSNDIGLVEELDFSSIQSPIQTNPNFATLVSTYGWDQATMAFPQAKPGGGESPVFGTTDFLSYSCVYRQIQTFDSIPSQILSNIGTIDEAGPPFHKLTDPADGDERTWLYLAPKIATRGNAFQITQEWMLSGFGTGWIPEIYSADSLSKLPTSNN